jgi:hypothetical protein
MAGHRASWATLMLMFSILLFYSNLALAAGCDLTGFDQSPPHAVKDTVNNQYADFEWASDVDQTNAGLRVWHYILNTGSKALGVDWDKADIHAALANPIPPGKAFCNRFIADAVAPAPDTDAPIVYGLSGQHQRAAIYVAQKAPNLSSNSTISSSYTDKQGKIVDVDVQISSGVTKEGFFIQVVHSPNLIVGISGLRRALTDNQFEALTSSLKAQSASASSEQYLAKFGADTLRKMFADAKTSERLTRDYLFLQGNPKWRVEIPAKSLIKRSTDVVVLNNDLQPILVTNVALVVPSQ